MTSIGIAGDWHGRGTWGIQMLKKFHQAEITEVYHLGDFGVYKDRSGLKYVVALERQLKLYGQRMYVTLGNHEDYNFIESIEPDEQGIRKLSERIFLLPRGYRWQIDDKEFVSLGGAASIDFMSRKEDKSWWKQEAITTEDLLTVARGGEADIMLTHEAPLGIKALDILKAESPDGWDPVELAYAQLSQEKMTMAVETVRPLMFFHGHFHHGYHEEVTFTDVSGSSCTTAVYGMNENGFKRNIGILNCTTLDFRWIN